MDVKKRARMTDERPDIEYMLDFQQQLHRGWQAGE
jgi:hypothetical protein